MHSLKEFGPVLVVLGLAVAAFGVWLTAMRDGGPPSSEGGYVPSGETTEEPPAAPRRSLFGWFGRLPGDIRYESSGTRIYIPLTSMLIVSVVLTLLFQIRRLF